MTMESQNNNNNSSSLGKLDVAVIHRVLLTESTDFVNLTLSGQPRVLHTPSLEEFSHDISDNVHPSHAIKKAFRDFLVDQLLQQQQNDDEDDDEEHTSTNSSRVRPLQSLVLELHQNIRSLVPNRADLHSLLRDDNVATATTLSDIMALLIRAAQGLQQLESEVRAETTQEWIAVAQQQQQQQQQASYEPSFVVTSLLYLLYKCELCQADKNDFYLSQVWAPRIHGGEGAALERNLFFQRYGHDLSDLNTAPRTRQWIQSLVSQAMIHHHDNDDDSSPTNSTLETMTAKRDLIRLGWINGILFRSTDQSALKVPEILALDIDRLQSIRQVTRWAAAGCALTLLISHVVAGTGKDATLSPTTPAPPLTPLAMRQYGLMSALQTRSSSSSSSSSIETYETNVVEQVIALALECQPALDAASQEALHHRALAVLRGQDPVLGVLDQRMKQIFGQLVVVVVVTESRVIGGVPAVVRSGRTPIATNITSGNNWNPFLDQARQTFTQRGLALYANPLAMAAKMAKKIIDLAWIQYEDVLDQMIQQACEQERAATVATS